MHFQNILFVLSLAFFSCSEASISLEIVPKNDAYPNQCYVERLKMAFDFNKAYPVHGDCAEMKCNDSYQLQTTGCSVFAVQPPCKRIEGNNQLPFPKCCPQPSC